MILACVIIDDEPLARKGLIEYIQDVDFLQLAGEFDSPLKATDTLMHQPVDLIFLDIQLPKITGLDFLKTLSHPPLVIFTTAYPQYAVEGFELNAVDYLLKPFSFERFLKAAVKARVRIEGSGHAIAPATPTDQEPGYFFIKSENKLLKIRHEDILFVEALQNYVAVHTQDKKYIAYLTFKTVEDHLPPGRFLRIHKSYIVSLSKIDSIEGNVIKIGSYSLPVGRTSREEVLNRILQNRYLKR